MTEGSTQAAAATATATAEAAGGAPPTHERGKAGGPVRRDTFTSHWGSTGVELPTKASGRKHVRPSTASLARSHGITPTAEEVVDVRPASSHGRAKGTTASEAATLANKIKGVSARDIKRRMLATQWSASTGAQDGSAKPQGKRIVPKPKRATKEESSRAAARLAVKSARLAKAAAMSTHWAPGEATPATDPPSRRGKGRGTSAPAKGSRNVIVTSPVAEAAPTPHRPRGMQGADTNSLATAVAPPPAAELKKKLLTPQWKLSDGAAASPQAKRLPRKARAKAEAAATAPSIPIVTAQQMRSRNLSSHWRLGAASPQTAQAKKAKTAGKASSNPPQARKRGSPAAPAKPTQVPQAAVARAAVRQRTEAGRVAASLKQRMRTSQWSIGGPAAADPPAPPRRQRTRKAPVRAVKPPSPPRVTAHQRRQAFMSSTIQLG